VPIAKEKISALIRNAESAFQEACADPRDHNIYALLKASRDISLAQPGSDVVALLLGLEQEAQHVLSLTSTGGRKKRLEKNVHYFHVRLSAAHDNDCRSQARA